MTGTPDDRARSPLRERRRGAVGGDMPPVV